MFIRVITASGLALAMLGGSALAQNGTVTGATGGAVTGAIVGGPVGAAVGGVAGGVLGTLLSPPPPEVRQVVIEQPGEPITIERQVVVGEPLPETVVVQPVPGYETYGYTVVNNQRVIVDPQTRTVIEVVQ
jgi:hypothetical protein